jgi:quercetin dioxygenase-like cupin family protein
MMKLAKGWIGMVAVAWGGVLATHLAWSQTDASQARRSRQDRARTVISQALPALDGDHLKAILLEVRYRPGEASPPHRHPCAVVGYVIEGSLRTQLEGQPEMIYKAGQTFYEAPNGVHLVSANASSTQPAKLLAYFICDRDTPLTIDGPEMSGPEGESR